MSAPDYTGTCRVNAPRLLHRRVQLCSLSSAAAAPARARADDPPHRVATVNSAIDHAHSRCIARDATTATVASLGYFICLLCNRYRRWPRRGHYHRGTMTSPGLFYFFVSLRTQTNATIQCLTTPMYCSIDASTGRLDAVRIVSNRFSSRYGHLPRRRAAVLQRDGRS